MTVRDGPKRATSGPLVGRPSTDPTDTHSSSSPSWPVLRPSASRTAGRRDTHEAKTSPLRAKTRATATRARSTTAAGALVVTARG